jgi:hypothetical protein
MYMERYEGLSRSPDSKWFATTGPSPFVPYFLRVLASRQSVHQFTLGNLFLTVAPAALCSTIQCQVPISPLEMLSTVTPSSPVRTPTLRKNVQMTCSLDSGSSIVVAPSICIDEVQPPLERVSCLVVIQVHSRGIPDGLPCPLPPLPLTLGLQSQKSIALQVDARIPGLVPRQLLSVSRSHSLSTVGASMCTNKLTERITYLSHPIGTV